MQQRFDITKNNLNIEQCLNELNQLFKERLTQDNIPFVTQQISSKFKQLEPLWKINYLGASLNQLEKDLRTASESKEEPGLIVAKLQALLNSPKNNLKSELKQLQKNSIVLHANILEKLEREMNSNWDSYQENIMEKFEERLSEDPTLLHVLEIHENKKLAIIDDLNNDLDQKMEPFKAALYADLLKQYSQTIEKLLSNQQLGLEGTKKAISEAESNFSSLFRTDFENAITPILAVWQESNKEKAAQLDLDMQKEEYVDDAVYDLEKKFSTITEFLMIKHQTNTLLPAIVQLEKENRNTRSEIKTHHDEALNYFATLPQGSYTPEKIEEISNTVNLIAKNLIADNKKLSIEAKKAEVLEKFSNNIKTNLRFFCSAHNIPSPITENDKIKPVVKHHPK